jgi:hypothetical protein
MRDAPQIPVPPIKGAGHSDDVIGVLELMSGTDGAGIGATGSGGGDGEVMFEDVKLLLVHGTLPLKKGSLLLTDNKLLLRMFMLALIDEKPPLTDGTLMLVSDKLLLGRSKLPFKTGIVSLADGGDGADGDEEAAWQAVLSDVGIWPAEQAPHVFVASPSLAALAL